MFNRYGLKVFLKVFLLTDKKLSKGTFKRGALICLSGAPSQKQWRPFSGEDKKPLWAGSDRLPSWYRLSQCKNPSLTEAQMDF